MSGLGWSERAPRRPAWPRAAPRAAAFVFALLVALGAVPRARAQETGSVAGVVVAEGSAAPISGAQVAAEGTPRATVTDAAGRFTLGGLPAGEVRLTARRIGFALTRATARVGATDVRIVLAERAAQLDEVVVTGTAGVTERRAVGNAVSNIDAAEIAATQPVRSFQDLLTGRASGVSVVASSGQVGTGSRIRVRGASSLSLANDPLIYVDGIRVDNTQASGPTNQAFGSRSVSRFNDFDPDDIESIEVIKGPAAATLYGTEASNGVIQIITKRGAAGRPVWNATVRAGANWIPDWQNRFFTNYGAVPRPGGAATARDTVTITVAQLNDSLRANYGNDIFRTGQLRDYQLSVSGGTPAFRYFAGGNFEDNQGVERVNSVDRKNFRVNLTASPGSKWDVQTSMGYTTGRTTLPLESGGGGATWATYFSSPGFLYSGTGAATAAGNPQLGFRSGPPNIYYQTFDIFQDADRFTGSFTFTNRPTSWFNHRLITGLDKLVEDNQEVVPRNDPIAARFASFQAAGGTTNGYIDGSTRDATNSTFDYLANATLGLGPAWRSVTSAGGQYYGRRTRVRGFYAENFPAAGLIALSAASVQRLGTDDVVENNTVGAFVQEQVIWNNRLFLTAAVRTDDNSAFGTNFDAVTYPKFSASYVLGEEPALRIPEAINTLRVRAAYGASGLQPGAFDALRTYTSNNTGGFVTPFSVGNPDLGPERSAELELGVDVGAFDDRYGAELTYFDGTTRDAILSRQAAPSGGVPGFQFFNAGRVDRSGFEWLLRAQPIRSPRVALDLTVSGSTNSYVIRSLGDAGDRVSLSGQIQHVAGYSPGAWWDRRVVGADINEAGRASNVQCDDGKGGQVLCAQAPRVYLGSSIPRREGSVTAGLTLLQNFRLNAFVDYRGGYKKLDGNRRVRCDLFFLCEENYFQNAVNEDGTRKFDAVALAVAQGGGAYTSHLIRDASFVRFRELAATYTLPESLSRRAGVSRAALTVAGRNLGLFTDYPGIDPEASFNGGTRGGAFGQWEQNVLPQTRQFVTSINLNF